MGNDEQVANILTKPLSRMNFGVFPQQAWCILEGLSSKGGEVMGLQMMDPLRKRKIRSNTWEQVDDMETSQERGSNDKNDIDDG